MVQSIVGHGNPAVTRHYVHIDNESVKQAINALPQGKQLLNEPQGKTDNQKINKISKLLENSKSNPVLKQQILINKIVQDFMKFKIKFKIASKLLFFL